MRIKPLDTDGAQRTFLVVFDIGDEVVNGLRTVAREHSIEGAYFSAIGALSDATLGYWSWETKEYRKIAVHEQVEVLSLAGNLARTPDGSVQPHAHLVIGKSDGSAHGGHLLEAHVRPTLEVILTEVPEHLRRQLDVITGLPLLDASP